MTQRVFTYAHGSHGCVYDRLAEMAQNADLQDPVGAGISSIGAWSSLEGQIALASYFAVTPLIG